MSENMLCNNLLVGISGSIHALHIYDYLRLFRESLTQEIKVIMTPNAAKVVEPNTVELFSDDHVFIDQWDQSSTISRIPHIQLTQWADLFVVVPATANIIGKAANGIADDLLSTAILSYPGAIAFVPVMEVSMWQSKALQRNIKSLEQDGHYIVPPTTGGFAVGTRENDGMSPVIETVLLHLKQMYMKQLRNEYWDDATRERPLTPMEKKQQDFKDRVIKLKKSTSIEDVLEN